MAKQIWKPGNMLYPLPAVMVSTADKSGKSNIITVAWTGTVCTNPAMLYISVRPERYSYDLLKDSGEFVVNLTTEKLKKATDWCGVRSGRDVDKWKEMHLTAGRASKLDYAPIIEECPVNIECKVTEIKELGSHHMFLAKVEAVQVGEEYLDEKGRLQLGKAGLLALVCPLFLCAQRTEFSKSVCGEKDFFRFFIFHHDLRPVYHRCHHKMQLMCSEL